MQELDKDQRKKLIADSHKIHPVVNIGQKGLSNAVHIEIERGLEAHELIKIKVAGTEKEARNAMWDTISKHHEAILVNQIGFVGTFYRKKKE